MFLKTTKQLNHKLKILNSFLYGILPLHIQNIYIPFCSCLRIFLLKIHFCKQQSFLKKLCAKNTNDVFIAFQLHTLFVLPTSGQQKCTFFRLQSALFEEVLQFH